MNTPYAARRDRLRQLMRARGLDALLVSHAANRFYLSGFELHDVQLNESAGRLVICADGRDWLCTDARYKDAAARLWDEDRILIYGPDAATEIGQLMRRCGSRLGLEAEIVSLNFARSLGRAVGRGAHLQAADGLVEELRADYVLLARSDMASFVDSLVAPLSVINALIVALGLRRKDELSEHFRLMEGIWDEYRVYVGKDRV